MKRSCMYLQGQLVLVIIMLHAADYHEGVIAHTLNVRKVNGASLVTQLIKYINHASLFGIISSTCFVLCIILRADSALQCVGQLDCCLVIAQVPDAALLQGCDPFRWHHHDTCRM